MRLNLPWMIFTRLTDQPHEILQAIMAGDPPQGRAAAIAQLDCVQSTLKASHEDQARQARITRLDEHGITTTRERDL